MTAILRKLNRGIFALEFFLAVFLLILCVIALFYFGLMFSRYWGWGVFLFLLPLVASAYFAAIAIYILGEAAFGDLKKVSKMQWLISGVACLVCLASLLLIIVVPKQDSLIPLYFPGYGSILVIAFIHCWVANLRIST